MKQAIEKEIQKQNPHYMMGAAQEIAQETVQALAKGKLYLALAVVWSTQGGGYATTQVRLFASRPKGKVFNPIDFYSPLNEGGGVRPNELDKAAILIAAKLGNAVAQQIIKTIFPWEEGYKTLPFPKEIGEQKVFAWFPKTGQLTECR